MKKLWHSSKHLEGIGGLILLLALGINAFPYQQAEQKSREMSDALVARAVVDHGQLLAEVLYFVSDSTVGGISQDSVEAIRTRRINEAARKLSYSTAGVVFVQDWPESSKVNFVNAMFDEAGYIDSYDEYRDFVRRNYEALDKMNTPAGIAAYWGRISKNLWMLFCAFYALGSFLVIRGIWIRGECRYDLADKLQEKKINPQKSREE